MVRLVEEIDAPTRRSDLASPTPIVSPPSPARPVRRCFRTTPSGTTTTGRTKRQSRAKLTLEEREKVRQVRRQRACLRCRILKIQCSVDNPCQPCLLSAVRGFERKVLSFCYCVRTRFADVNIFDNPSTTGSRGTAASIMQIETLMQAMAGLLERIAAPADFNLTSSPETFNSTMLRWLTDPSFHLPNGSIVGLCCSSLLGLQFQEEKESAADGLVDDFKQFLLATSLVHAEWKDQRVGKGDDKKRIRTRELYAASQMTGSRLLKRLDRILTPQFLGKCGRESCQVLFLLVLGAALGVAYASSSVVSAELRQQRLELASSDALRGISSPLLSTTTTPASSASSLSPAALLSPEFQRSPTLWLAMKEHLCQMLAHHLIFIGSMLGIKLDTAVERHIIDTAVARWNKAEEYVWANAVPVIPTPGKKAGGRKVEEGPQRESSEEPRDPLREGELEDAGSTDGETKAPTHRPPMPPPPLPRLAPIPCPEIKEFHPEVIRDWGQNPQSFLDMFNEDFDFDTPSVDNKTTDGDCGGEAGRGQKRKSPLTTTPDLDPPSRDLEDTPESHPQRRELKRRSIWLVRPVDAGPDHGVMNFHARLRGGVEMFGSFV